MIFSFIFKNINFFHNHKVGGSIPPLATKKSTFNPAFAGYFFWTKPNKNSFLFGEVQKRIIR